MRPDISDYIIHFTKGETPDVALENLWSILRDGRIRANTRLIKGEFPCVCFTEAPLEAVKEGLLNLFGEARYSPFGIKFHKNQVFEMGGRPVIYSPDSEYEHIGEEMKWRHVRYELPPARTIDFTWEREWRLQCDSLPISPDNCEIVVPDEGWIEQLRKHHDDQQMSEYAVRCGMMDESEAYAYVEPFRWQVSTFK